MLMRIENLSKIIFLSKFLLISAIVDGNEFIVNI